MYLMSDSCPWSDAVLKRAACAAIFHLLLSRLISYLSQLVDNESLFLEIDRLNQDHKITSHVLRSNFIASQLALNAVR